MIYVSHNAAEVQRIATRVVRINGGRVTATGRVELVSLIKLSRRFSSGSNAGKHHHNHVKKNNS